MRREMPPCLEWYVHNPQRFELVVFIALGVLIWLSF